MPLMLVFNGMEAGSQTWYEDLDTGAIVQVFPGSEVPVRKVNDYEQYVEQGVAEVTGDEDGSDGRLDQITDAIRAILIEVAPLDGDSSAWTLDDMLVQIEAVRQADTDALDGYVAIPDVISTTPADEAVDVALDAVISVTFSKSMDPATMLPSRFTVFSDDVGVSDLTTTSISISDLNRHAVLNIDPETPMVNGATYRIRVARQVHDPLGQVTAEGGLGEGHSGYESPTGFTTIAV